MVHGWDTTTDGIHPAIINSAFSALSSYSGAFSSQLEE